MRKIWSGPKHAHVVCNGIRIVNKKGTVTDSYPRVQTPLNIFSAELCAQKETKMSYTLSEDRDITES